MGAPTRKLLDLPHDTTLWLLTAMQRSRARQEVRRSRCQDCDSPAALVRTAQGWRYAQMHLSAPDAAHSEGSSL
ncbi:MAG: hypothetical protein WBC17_16830 [Mycobacterium sp.]